MIIFALIIYLFYCYVHCLGDISEDPVFPKEVFPVKEFCSRCYSGVKAGTTSQQSFAGTRGSV